MIFVVHVWWKAVFQLCRTLSLYYCFSVCVTSIHEIWKRFKGYRSINTWKKRFPIYKLWFKKVIECLLWDNKKFWITSKTLDINAIFNSVQLYSMNRWNSKELLKGMFDFLFLQCGNVIVTVHSSPKPAAQTSINRSLLGVRYLTHLTVSE